MKIVSDAEFGGERPLFATHDITLENVTIHAGESALKCCSEITAAVSKANIRSGTPRGSV